jgi:hypothetical protein
MKWPFGIAILSTAIVSVHAFGQTVEIDPTGRPTNLGRAKGAHYGVWLDDEGWHVRTEGSGNNPHVFEGRIEVEGGKVEKVFNFESFDTTASKNRKKPDTGFAGQKFITFRVKSGKKGDGFGFRVSDNTTKVRFRLMIDGNTEPDRIMVGSAGQHAPSGTFELSTKSSSK